MAALGNVSVTSAAIIEGSLIIGLSDGSIINCGYVQGPQGLKGDRGPMGATGERGTDGATIHTVKVPHQPTSAKKATTPSTTGTGSFSAPKPAACGVRARACCPRTSTNLFSAAAPTRAVVRSAEATTVGAAASTVQFSPAKSLQLERGRLKPSGRGSKVAVNYPGSANGIISPSGDMNFQSNINGWIVDALDELEGAIPVPVVDSLPGAGDYDGQLVLHEGSLQIWVGSEWVKVSADGGAYIGVAPPMPAEEGQLWFNNSETSSRSISIPGKWVPASPPVSLDGINNTITGIEGDLIELHNNVRQVKGDIVLTNQDLQLVAQGQQDLAEDQTRQDEKIAELEAEVDDLRPTIERGEWLYNSEPESESNPKAGEYHAYVVVSDDYCKQQLGECLLNAGGDTAAASQCNRENEDCLSKIGEADTNVTWHEVEWLSLSQS